MIKKMEKEKLLKVLNEIKVIMDAAEETALCELKKRDKVKISNLMDDLQPEYDGDCQGCYQITKFGKDVEIKIESKDTDCEDFDKYISDMWIETSTRYCTNINEMIEAAEAEPLELMKLNEVLRSNKLIIHGFKAFTDLAAGSKQDGPEMIISTLTPALMFDMGILEYCAPVIPRGSRFVSFMDVIDADLDIYKVTVTAAEPITAADLVVIASQHPGTVEILMSMYPNYTAVLSSVTVDDIKGKDVVGTLPAHLISEAARFTGVTIRDFDYAKDGDLSGSELADRIVINPAISVKSEK